MELMQPIETRLIISSILMLAGLICFILSKKPPLSRKELEELEECNRILLEPYRPKEYNTDSKTGLKEL